MDDSENIQSLTLREKSGSNCKMKVHAENKPYTRAAATKQGISHFVHKVVKQELP
jgi:hypothetical protein